MSGSTQDAVLATPSSTTLYTTPGNTVTEGYFQRRLRHVTSIQIRNLTPFPVRDAFASALSHPAVHSQFTPLGNLSDDLDVTLMRKRPRRISTTSVMTLKNSPVDDITSAPDDFRGSGEGRGRRRAQSRVGFSRGGSVAASSGGGNNLSRSMTTTTAGQITRPTRVRTPSGVSSNSLSASLPSGFENGSVSGTPSASTLYFDHSQRTLEKVIKSRLVETFITITVPEPESPPPHLPPMSNGQSRYRAESVSLPSLPIDAAPPNGVSTATARKVATTSRVASIRATKTISTRAGPSMTTRSSTPARKPLPIAKAASSSSATRPPTKSHKSSSSAPLAKSSSHQSPLSSPAEPASLSKVPNYISPIHRPSTNPIYGLDAQSKSDFAESTDLSADTLRIQLWAKVDVSEAQRTSGSGKGKQKESAGTGSSAHSIGWKVLEEWNFVLLDLIPLPLELENHPSRLPSNTLVISFLPTGQSFYLPPPSRPRSRSHSRSPSRSGYNTDPESEIRKISNTSQAVPPVSCDMISASDNLSRLSLLRKSRKLGARTATLQELSQLASLQALMVDTKASLHDIIGEIDSHLAHDYVVTLKRETSERQERIQDRQAETRAMIERSNYLRGNIASRRMQIQARRENLAKARGLQAQDATSLSQETATVTEQRNDLTALHNRILPTRTSLISTLSTIYPIELLSPSELLFTILAVPLPIPFTSNEPAPPLSLSSYKEVTEDAVATALGYAAHLVQLLAVYMGKGLVYPVTYIGSRSLIRDNISAMVGPRMFPLFSKGVDTYRFEYAVFLLNKDIEMLMADRDLRALDMRHTLPNLKNLLLTVTDGECTSLFNPIYDDSSSSMGLATPPSASTPPALNLTTDAPKAEQNPHLSAAELPQEDDISSSCGATTPTATSTDGGTSTLSRYSKLSLGFPPFRDFLRSRNSSTVLRSSAKTVPDPVEERQEIDISGGTPSDLLELANSSGKLIDDDDRRTIKGVVVDHTAEQSADSDVKGAGNGHTMPDGTASAQEKHPDETALTTPSPVVSVDGFL
ncbi:hypothetical protein PAXRUDRAFT_824462 [Paxillus rubicundulus Ve08.2h10]|uniref:Autophagy-related protein 14 n=1 Tax=Paxillus rubicundulus Ve08.2h10 TaxID=930991 RepID=A0A0D0DHW8_9AGAM|nr:hypothetical protein PAXRUDRAFT_824462 [Paxillus rubicundulus Ve08.2h10]